MAVQRREMPAKLAQLHTFVAPHAVHHRHPPIWWLLIPPW